MKKRNQHGFTLMELMVVIVIVAILAAVAVPLYINYVNDARRTEAKGAIAALISGAQVFYQRQPIPTYAGLYGGTNADSVRIAAITAESAARWTYAFSNMSATGFTVTATGIGTAQGLGVTCVYTRTPAPGAEPATWTEQ